AVDPATSFPRQALHAATLGFRHPIDGRELLFERPPPADFAHLVSMLSRNCSIDDLLYFFRCGIFKNSKTDPI
ncbi:MAG: hypothetical protein VYA68_11755, partial [Pseudomonadota bacterium]|nr:hypothetical protein [Pseudomonadota bacterium]